MIEVARRWTVVALSTAAFAVAVVGCGGATSAAESEGGADHPLSAGLALLPDVPELRRHVLVADLERLRRAYPHAGELQAALVGVWLPDALVGANSALWRRTFGLRLEDVSAFASAGFHPAELAVALGEFRPAAMRTSLRHAGYRVRDGVLARRGDGSIDVTTAAGRLALSSLNRVLVGSDRVVAASTSALATAAHSPSRELGQDPDFAALAAALDPVTSAIILDAGLVRPPSGVPVRVLAQHSARLVGVGIDDAGPARRVLKIALVYAQSSDARSDAALIEKELGSTPLAGVVPETRFADIASDWRVGTDDRTVVLTGLLAPGSSSEIWRLLVERGDLGPFLRPAG